MEGKEDKSRSATSVWLSNDGSGSMFTNTEQPDRNTYMGGADAGFFSNVSFNSCGRPLRETIFFTKPLSCSWFGNSPRSKRYATSSNLAFSARVDISWPLYVRPEPVFPTVHNDVCPATWPRSPVPLIFFSVTGTSN